MGFDVAKVAAIQQDAAGSRVIKAGDQVSQRRLAGTAAADQSDRLARFDVQVDAAEDFGIAAGVVEADVTEIEFAAGRGAADANRRGVIGEFAGVGEDIEDAVQRGEVRLERDGAGGQGGEWVEEHRQVDEEHHQFAERQFAVDDLVAAIDQQQRRGERQEDFPDEFDRAGPPPGVELLSDEEIAFADEARGFVSPAGEGPDDADAAEGFGRGGIDQLALFADVAKQRSDAIDPCPVAQPDHRQQQQPADHQFPIDQDEDDEAAEELDDRPPGVVKHVKDQFGDAAGIFADQARDPARLEPLDPLQRELEHVVIDLAADRHLGTVDRKRRGPAGPKPQDGADQRHDRHRDGDRHQQTHRRGDDRFAAGEGIDRAGGDIGERFGGLGEDRVDRQFRRVGGDQFQRDRNGKE